MDKRVPWIAVSVVVLAALAVWAKLVVLILVGAVSVLYKAFFKVKIGFELVTFVTVIAGVTAGPKAGILVGAGSALLGMSLNLHAAKDPLDTSLNLVVMMLVGFLAGIFSQVNVVVLGIVLTVVFDVIYLSARLVAYPRIANYPLYVVTHWLFSIAFFRALGPVVVRLM